MRKASFSESVQCEICRFDFSPLAAGLEDAEVGVGVADVGVLEREEVAAAAAMMASPSPIPLLPESLIGEPISYETLLLAERGVGGFDP